MSIPLKVGDRVKLNETLCSDGLITKVNPELGVVTVMWSYVNFLGKKHTIAQLHYIEEFEIENIIKFV